MINVKAVDLFSIATCEVSGAGSTLVVKGGYSISFPERTVLIRPPKLRNVFRKEEKRGVLR